jgi:hypothetical protein
MFPRMATQTKVPPIARPKAVRTVFPRNTTAAKPDSLDYEAMMRTVKSLMHRYADTLRELAK